MKVEAIKKGEHSRQVILEAARHIIAARGFLGITVQDILVAAKVTKGKFFHHFSSKEALFSQLIIESLAAREFPVFLNLAAECEAARPFERLLHILDTLIRWHNEGLPEVMRLCVVATYFFAPDSQELKQIRAKLSANTAVVEQLVKESQCQGQLPIDLDPKVLSLMIPSLAVGGSIVGFLHGSSNQTSANLKQIKQILIALNPEQVRNSQHTRVLSGSGIV